MATYFATSIPTAAHLRSIHDDASACKFQQSAGSQAMMTSQNPGPTTSLFSRAPLRVSRLETPRTPEPMTKDEEHESRAPSPPRPRLKLKRRNVSQQHPLTAPTQHFLASVAAADIPIPSIEEPEIAADDDSDMTGTFAASIGMDDLHPFGRRGEANGMELDLSLKLRGRRFSIPKTPAPGLAPSLSPTRYPNWSTGSSFSSSTDDESSPEPDYSSLSRPSTSRSTYTSYSLFSRLSHFSDDRCVSPEAEQTANPAHDDRALDTSSGESSNPGGRSRARRAPWTKAMIQHLWATYMIYLQDPRVTPFRTGKSCIPPHGVCLRVAREAKKSWKGSKVSQKLDGLAIPEKSGSATPTGDWAGSFIEWPHTCASTRTRLRELCKQRAAAPGGGLGLRYMSRSPTPFKQVPVRHRNRRSTPGRKCTAFATKDIALSLVVSTSDSMCPNGPLAQLSSSTIPTPEPTPTEPSSSISCSNLGTVNDSAADDEAVAQHTSSQNETRQVERPPSPEPPRRLGSPFVAKSYGPTSSASLAAVLGLGGPGAGLNTRPAPHTVVGARRATLNSALQSPVRLSRTSNHRRRVTAYAGGRAPHHELQRKRPSLGSDFWIDPNSTAAQPPSSGDVGARGLDAAAPFYPTSASTSASASGSNSSFNLFIPRMTSSLGPSLTAGHPVQQQPRRSQFPTSTTAPELSTLFQMEEPTNPPARLGSPFSMSNTSFSFPNRFFQPTSSESTHSGDILLTGSRDRPFAADQQPKQQQQQQEHDQQYAPPIVTGQQPPFSSSFTFGEGEAARARARAPSAAAAEGPAPSRDNLARRLEYIDQRLKEFRNRDINRRRSGSPF